jgi:hypothetical protein
MPSRLARALIAACALVLAGCPGSIDDPSRFRAAANAICPDDFDVERDLFARTCAQLTCHTGGPTLAASGLDLSAPGVRERLLMHTSADCAGRPLIDPERVEDSYLFVKVDQDSPPCGDRMPSGMAVLNPIERACLGEYVSALIAPSDGGVPAADAEVGW